MSSASEARDGIKKQHADIIARALGVAGYSGNAEQLARIARKLERGCRVYVLKRAMSQNLPTCVQLKCDSSELNFFTMEYSGAVHRICELLRDKGRELVTRLERGEIEPEHVAEMRIEEVCPSVLAHERAEYAMRREQKIEYKTTTAYRCSKCGTNDAHFFECQTRGSDEASTIFLVCKGCQHRWRV